VTDMLQAVEWEDIPAPETDLHCDVCGRTGFKTEGGIKRHKTTQHGDGTSADPEKVSVARKVQRDTSGRGAPTADQLTVATGRLLGYGSIFVASEIVDSDPRRPEWTDDQADKVIDSLSATPDEAKEIMRPLARIFAGTKVNKRVGRKIVDNIDAADSLMALFAMARRWQSYMVDRNEYAKTNGIVKPQRRTKKPAPPRQVDPYTVTEDSGERVLEGVTPMDNRTGVVVTPEMVQAMRARS
jgi:hypothetical protein